MMGRFILSITALLFSAICLADMNDDPILFMVKFDKLEIQDTEEDTPFVWDADAWIGKDLNKLWLKSEGEYIDGTTHEIESSVLYSRAIAPFWDAQLGYFQQATADANRNYASFGFKGLAPYFFETDISLSIGEHGQSRLNLDFEYEFLLTQRLILTPEIELNAYGKDDQEMGNGSGFSDSEVGLRLRYEIRREFAPYIGINWQNKFGNAADFARQQGESTADSQLVIGIRAWF